MDGHVSDPVVLQIEDLLLRSGLDSHLITINPLSNGGNNKAWRVETTNSQYVAKQYFRHPDDQRDRLAADFWFTQYVFALAPNSSPRPIGCDDSLGIALYEFVSGDSFCPEMVDKNSVRSAADFFILINPVDRLKRASHISDATESCFSIADHLSLVRSRIKALIKAVAEEEVFPEIRPFIQKLEHCWDRLEKQIVVSASRSGLDLNAVLPPNQRCLSPSDFGFHNAIRKKSGDICYFDFEYAGWDDPAKMVGDFFSQLAIPVSAVFFDFFTERALSQFPDPETLKARAVLLYPVYLMKWCCIALNIFLPIHLARRKFANPDLIEKDLKYCQWLKAKDILNRINL